MTSVILQIILPMNEKCNANDTHFFDFLCFKIKRELEMFH